LHPIKRIGDNIAEHRISEKLQALIVLPGVALVRESKLKK
jgi:hypothetical protein